MARHRVPIADIAALPAGRRKGILARKAMAVCFGYSDTGMLRTNRITTAMAVAALPGMADELGMIVFAAEPADPTDRTQSPALLIEYALCDAASDAALFTAPSARRRMPFDANRRGLGRRWFSREVAAPTEQPTLSRKPILC